MLPRPVVIGLAILVAVAWATNFTIGMLYPGRSDPALNTIFAIVVGAVFTLDGGKEVVTRIRRKRAESAAVEDKPRDRGDQS